MDDFFIKSIDWDSCTDPINAIDFSAQLATLEKLEAILELLGLTLYEPVVDTLSNTQHEYLNIGINGTCVQLMPCDDRIAPVPTHYIDTVIPALILAHIDNPVSVKQVYNEFFINKKEEITPLLDQ